MKTIKHELKTIYVASANKNKIAEIKRLLVNYDIKSLLDLNITDDIEETGKTYKENALIKANYLHKLGYDPVLAEDSGFEIDALYSRPNIYSKRAYPQKNDIDAMNQVLLDMKNSPIKTRYASYKVSIVLIINNHIRSEEATVRGHMAFKPIGNNGYMYDKIFCPQKIVNSPFEADLPINSNDKTFAEMTSNNRDQFNARKEAIIKMFQPADPNSRK